MVPHQGQHEVEESPRKYTEEEKVEVVEDGEELSDMELIEVEDEENLVDIRL